MDTISRLSSIYIRIAPNSIRYTLTTIYYPSCQQISVCYNILVQCYSQRIYIQHQIGSFLTNDYLQFHCTKFNCYYTHECKVIHKEFIYSNQIGSFLTILDTISRLSSIYIRIAPNSIRYTLTRIYYPSCQQISVCYNSRVQCYSQRIYIQQSNWFIFNHFGHYFQIIFNLYSYCTKFNSIHINYNILSILSTNFSML